MIPKEKQYGGPSDRTKPYYPDIYCGMCNQVPVQDTWDRSTGKIIGAYIPELWPVPMQKGIGPEAKEVEIMVCSACLARIEAQMNKEVRRRKETGEWPFGPDGPLGGTGGGLGVRPRL